MRPVSLAFICLLFFPFLSLNAQNGNTAYWEYIGTYKDMAIKQMLRYRIPASITLAQGLLESGAGKSRLAREANNHFGIKCNGRWNGPYIRQDDDAPGEKFRKYKNAEASYEDHSLFLQQPRYASLFKLKIDDYKGWAHGLKRCGYATNPRYAYSLIDIVERYNLSHFDKVALSSRGKRYHGENGRNVLYINDHVIYRNNDNYYLIVQSGDNLKAISEETGVSVRRILKYNELPKTYTPKVGDVLYLEKKKRKADKMFKRRPHVVQPGESMYSIAQRYAIRLESLYEMNDLPVDYAARVNDRLRVR
mgnify:CR=1 FL=1